MKPLRPTPRGRLETILGQALLIFIPSAFRPSVSDPHHISWASLPVRTGARSASDVTSETFEEVIDSLLFEFISWLLELPIPVLLLNLLHETADEARGSGEAQSPGQ